MNRRSRFVMPDDLAKEAPERFEPAREEYRREGRDDLDDEWTGSPLAQLMSREEASRRIPTRCDRGLAVGGASRGVAGRV